MAIQSLYPAIKPSLNLDFANTRALDPRITFTRASTATYYDGQTVAMAEQNLVTYSQAFNNWSTNNASVTADVTTAPDGTSTADKIIANTTTDYHFIRGSNTFVSSGNAYTSSVYAKAAEVSKFDITCATNLAAATFDLIAETATGIGGSSASITAVGNGWYRCTTTITAPGSSADSMWILPWNVAGTNIYYAGDGTSGIYIWGAQLEQRSSVTAYTATTTQPITNYIPVLRTAAAGVPRFDCNPTTSESLGLLIEEQRTNLLTYSEDFDNAYWTKTNGAITTNQIVAPDGTLTGDLFTPTASAGASAYFYESSTSMIGSGFVFSICVKSNGNRYIQIGAANNGVSSSFANFDLQTETVGSIGGSITASKMTALGNGWYRLSATVVASVSGAPLIFFTPSPSNTAGYGPSMAHDGWSGFFVWGAQAEAGTFPTSYIATTSAQVTRSADAASMTGTNFSSWYRADEGTFYTEGYTSRTTAAFVTADTGSSSGLIEVFKLSNNARFGVYTQGAHQAELSLLNVASATNVKIAAAYKVNDFAGSCNNATVVTDTSGLTPGALTTLYFGGYQGAPSSSWGLDGTLKKVAYYPARLTNTQLKALTS